MADIGDVLNALATLAGTALYPNGVAAGSPLGLNFRIYRGHPGAGVLDADMQAGFAMGSAGWVLSNPAAQVAHVCVNARVGIGRLVKPYVFGGPQVVSTPTQTLTVAVSGDTVALGGTVAAGLGVAAATNGVAAGVTATASDTLATLATKLAAALTTAGATATAAGDVVTIPAATTLFANTFVQAVTGQEVERQIQGIELTLYVPSRATRDAVSAAIKPVFAQAQRITLADGFEALLRSAPPIEIDDDRPEKALLFIRKLYYQVEYATVLSGTAATLALSQQVITNPLGATMAVQVEA